MTNQVDPQRERKAVITILSVGVIAFILAFNAAGAVHRDFPAVEGASGLTQTWPNDYEWTTCLEFTNEMSARQQTVAAADLIQIAWKRLEDSTETVGTEIAGPFAPKIAVACQQIATLKGWDTSNVNLVDGFTLAYHDHPVKP